MMSSFQTDLSPPLQTQLLQLLQNPEKTECLVVVPPRLERSLAVPGLRVGGHPDHTLRYLGTTLDKHLNMTAHLSQVCLSCYFHLRNTGRIRQCLTNEAAITTLVHSLLAS